MASRDRLTYLKNLADAQNRESREAGARHREIHANLHIARKKVESLEGQTGRAVGRYSLSPDYAEPSFESGIALRNPPKTPTGGKPAAPLDRNSLAAQIAEAKARVADLEEAAKSSAEAQRDASDKWNASAQLLTKCRAFATENGLPLPVLVEQVGHDPNVGVLVHGRVM